jgi:Zn-dependent protease
MQESLPETTLWSFPLARLGSLRLRLHSSFLITGIIVFYLGWVAQRLDVTTWSWAWSLLTLALWLGAVVWHEFGHRLVALRLHAASREIVLTPVGGSLSPSTVTEPQNDLVLLVAGPLANLALCLLAAVVITVLQGSFVVPGVPPAQDAAAVLTAPGAPAPWVRAWGLVFWLNWALVLVNLIPALPFDGGRLLRAALHLITPQMPYAETLLVVSRVGRAVAVLALLGGFVFHDSVLLGLVPGWAIGAGLAMIVYFASRRAELVRAPDDQEDWPFGYDFSAGYTSLGWQSAPARPGPGRPNALSRWWEQRRQQQAADQRQRDAAEDGRLDEILVRVHQNGYHSLSVEEQKFLRRASARYRRRTR